MPETTAETPGQKLFRQWYSGNLAARLVQVASMERNRDLLRRGTRKMQDGNLGTAEGSSAEEEPVNITIGDQYINQPTESIPAKAVDAVASVAGRDWFKKAALSAALVVSGAGAGVVVPWLLGAFDKPIAVETPAYTDTNTMYELSIKP